MKLAAQITALIFLLTTATPAPAQVTPLPLPSAQSIVVRGPGGATCSIFLASPAANKGLFISWIQGYLTAYNQFQMGSGDIAANLSNEQINLGLENYCRSFPNDTFQIAATKLIETFRTSWH